MVTHMPKNGGDFLPPYDPFLRWQVRAGVWSLFLKPFNRRLAHLEPAGGGLYYLLIGAGRAGPYAKTRAFELGLEHARNRLARHKRAA
jgi:hypothetical protein